MPGDPRDDRVFEQLPFGLALFDAEGRCLTANGVFAGIVDCGVEDLVGMDLPELVGGRFGAAEAAADASNAFDATLGDGESRSFLEWRCPATGRAFDCAWCRASTVADGPPMMLTLADVSRYVDDRHALEERGRLAEALSGVASALSFSADLDEVLGEVVVTAADALACDAAVIEVPDGERWVVRHVNGLPYALIGTVSSLDDMPCAEEAIAHRCPVVIDELSDGLRLCGFQDGWGVQAVLVVPLIGNGEVRALLFFAYVEPGRTFSKAQMAFAAKVATTVTLVLENLRLAEMERETREALQSALLGVVRDVPGVKLGHLYRSATHIARVGGDFYELFPIDIGRVGVLIGDVSGKGLGAAALTALVKTTVKIHARGLDSPAAIFAKTNEVLAEESPVESFVTAFLGVLDTDSGRFRYCIAGHPPAILRRRDGVTALLRETSPILGAYREMEYEEHETYLENGDVLLLYTDGVTEARRDGEFYGVPRLVSLVASLTTADVRELPEIVFEEVFEHARGDMTDDMAVLALSPTEVGAQRAQGRFDI